MLTSKRIASVVFAALGLWLSVWPSLAPAQVFPAKPVRLIVPYPPGGPLDDVARAVGQKLAPLWGQQLLVDNRSGAGGSIGVDVVAKSASDGYTLVLANPGPMTINVSLRKDLPYDPQKDLAPVTQIISGPMVLVVHPSMPVKSVKELVALARAHPGKLNYASAGIGNLQHLGMEHLQVLAKVKMNHVPYKGAAPAFIDTLSGRIDLQFANIVGVLPHVESRRVRAIAISVARGASVLPDVPGVAATLPGFDLDSWMGIFARAGTPPEVIAKLHRDFASVVQSPDFRERFAKRGADVVVGGPEGLAKIVRDEMPLYAGIIKSAKITPE
ncbi:MAG: tripartite tricarboxylate transporter substrate binding protein [Burkholderiales bacterium]|nr:tripartite tricarboxylate transporter substrate binding protein [Burkholderiales bacterium]MCW5603820.1 tripartite tricarboxylate transporter substrate binding protein [Burkholderiales bacterium]